MTFTELLKRIESGMTTADDAKWLETQLLSLFGTVIIRGKQLGFSPGRNAFYHDCLEAVNAYTDRN
jgi:hypothetical protein